MDSLRLMIVEFSCAQTAARIAAAILALKSEAMNLEVAERPPSLREEPQRPPVAYMAPGKPRAQWKQERNAHRRAW